AKKDKDSKPEEKDKDKKKVEEPPIQPSETLRLEVLGNETLQKIAKSGDFDRKKLYRVVGEPRLLSLEDVKQLIVERLAASPPLRQVVLYIYADSPNQDKAQITDVKRWIEDDPKRKAVKVVERL